MRAFGKRVNRGSSAHNSGSASSKPAASHSPLGSCFTERRERGAKKRGAKKVAKKDGGDEGNGGNHGGSNAGAKGRKHR